MDFQPRKLPVFKRVEHTAATEPMVTDRKILCKWNAMECTYGKPVPCEGLGYERKAAGIRKGSSLTFAFDDYGKILLKLRSGYCQVIHWMRNSFVSLYL